jgi:hypothetical protein
MALQEDNMAARQSTSRSMKSISGAGVLTLGLFLLFVNLDGVAKKIGYTLELPTNAMGILPALGLAGMHALQAYAFDHAGFLSSLLQILVSFWPLLLIVAGATLLRPLGKGVAGPPEFDAESSATSSPGDR